MNPTYTYGKRRQGSSDAQRQSVVEKQTLNPDVTVSTSGQCRLPALPVPVSHHHPDMLFSVCRELMLQRPSENQDPSENGLQSSLRLCLRQR